MAVGEKESLAYCSGPERAKMTWPLWKQRSLVLFWMGRLLWNGEQSVHFQAL